MAETAYEQQRHSETETNPRTAEAETNVSADGQLGSVNQTSFPLRTDGHFTANGENIPLGGGAYENAGGKASSPESFVRLAAFSDAPQIGKLQAERMRAELLRTIAQVGPETLNLLQPAQFQELWAKAIMHPPSPKHHVLCAIHRGKVVGFAALAPVDLALGQSPAGILDEDEPRPRADQDGNTSPPPAPATSPLLSEPAQAEIVAFELADWEHLVGHEGRLINACADILRKSGAKRVQIWLNPAAGEQLRFWRECGFSPAGIRQVLQVGTQTLTQHLWYTDLT